MGKTLRYGYTTGACAAAAALGAALMLRDQRIYPSVELPLPAGFSVTFPLFGQTFSAGEAHCFVVKDAGDDPDVTNGVEVHAQVTLTPPLVKGGQGGVVVIEGGVGIGTVTKPGLAVPVGEAAINPVPRQMITEALAGVFTRHPSPVTIFCRLSIPDGEERAKRTLNARLGIVGGLSILGTTGVVRPLSHRAWTDTIDVALDVALAAGCRAVVLATGRTSEEAAMTELPLAEEAFVMMGDHVGYALEACHRKGVPAVILAVQFAKLVKIACGHPQTHVSASRLDLEELGRWGSTAGLDGDAVKKIECANTAREVYETLGPDHPLIAMAADHGLEKARQWAPGVAVAVFLAGYGNRPARRFGEWILNSAGDRGI
jgi:cobalt-precorrin-5B (C1)-methyltransferase